MFKKVVFGLYDVLVPHYVTEEWLLQQRDDGTYMPVCRVGKELLGDRVDGMAKLRHFTWLGRVWGSDQVARMRKY